jgi:hypothetical protein
MRYEKQAEEKARVMRVSILMKKEMAEEVQDGNEGTVESGETASSYKELQGSEDLIRQCSLSKRIISEIPAALQIDSNSEISEAQRNPVVMLYKMEATER